MTGINDNHGAPNIYDTCIVLSHAVRFCNSMMTCTRMMHTNLTEKTNNAKVNTEIHHMATCTDLQREHSFVTKKQHNYSSTQSCIPQYCLHTHVIREWISNIEVGRVSSLEQMQPKHGNSFVLHEHTLTAEPKAKTNWYKSIQMDSNEVQKWIQVDTGINHNNAESTKWGQLIPSMSIRTEQHSSKPKPVQVRVSHSESK